MCHIICVGTHPVNYNNNEYIHSHRYTSEIHTHLILLNRANEQIWLMATYHAVEAHCSKFQKLIYYKHFSLYCGIIDAINH